MLGIMSFAKKTAYLCLVLIIMISQFMIFSSSKVSAVTIINSDANNFYMENSKIKVTINKSTGFVKSVVNKVTGKTNKKDNTGAWPFAINISNGTVAEITSSTQNTISSSSITTSGNDSILQVTYNNLKTNGASPSNTGVMAVVKYIFNSNDSYIKFNVKFTNNGSNNINIITLCQGGSLSTGEAKSTLVVPIWGEVAFWSDPINQWKSATVKNPLRMSYPGTGWNDLEMGFVDYSGVNGGIGIAYIDKQQILMEFKVSTDNGGMSIAPSMLNPEIQNMIVPVKPNESITTDNVVVAAHTGDWHSMADIYRTEYNKAFTVSGKADYLTWNTISPIVKQTDVCLRYQKSPFSYVFQNVKSFLNVGKWGNLVSGQQVMVWYAGQNYNAYGHDTPSMIPADPALGGTAGLTALSNNLHSIGANIYHYEHPFAFATDSPDYPAIASANPNQSSAEWNGVNHYYVCIDNNLVMNLWKNKLIPEIAATKPDGMQWDQGSLQFTACNIAGHNHLLDAVSRLSSHSKAMKILSQHVRNNLNPGKISYLASEGFNDLTGRYTDIQQSRWDREQIPVFGGDLIFGGRQYVHPQFVNVYNSAMKTNDGIWKNRRQYIAIIGGICNLNEGEDTQFGADTEYLWFKRQMRQIKAPGYPFNYKDTVGVTPSLPELWTRVFTENNKATITFWAFNKSITDGAITIDPSKLGLTGASKSFKFDLGKNKTGYIVYNFSTNKVENTSVTIKNMPITSQPSKASSSLNSSISKSDTSNDTSNSSAVSDVSEINNSSISSEVTGSLGSEISSLSISSKSDTQTKTDKDQETDFVLIVFIAAIALIFVGFIIFVLVTELPKPIYVFLIKIFRR